MSVWAGPPAPWPLAPAVITTFTRLHWHVVCAGVCTMYLSGVQCLLLVIPFCAAALTPGCVVLLVCFVVFPLAAIGREPGAGTAVLVVVSTTWQVVWLHVLHMSTTQDPTRASECKARDGL